MSQNNFSPSNNQVPLDFFTFIEIGVILLASLYFVIKKCNSSEEALNTSFNRVSRLALLNMLNDEPIPSSTFDLQPTDENTSSSPITFGGESPGYETDIE